MRILLVEDDLMLGKALKEALENQNNVVDWVTDAELCKLAIYNTKFEILLLDINLPDQSGLEVLQDLRRQKNDILVLILTSRDGVFQKIEALDLGADDYLCKPFVVEELFARIRSLVRRSKGISTSAIVCGLVKLNPANFTVLNNEEQIAILPKEFNILKALMENADKVVSKARLEEILYSWDDSVESNTVEVYIHHLRKKLGKNFIKTIRGVGYMIERNNNKS